MLALLAQRYGRESLGCWRLFSLCFVLSGPLAFLLARADDTPRFGPSSLAGAERRAAPPVPPLRVASELDAPPQVLAPVPKSLGNRTLYSIGNPTDEEQLYVEFINRSRRDPQGEAERFRTASDPEILRDYRIHQVDLNRVVSQFSQLSPAPPVSLNANLSAAARKHSQDMFDNQFQGHEGTDGRLMDKRIEAEGYLWSAVAENVFINAHSVWHGHAAFDVDWGGPADKGGIQDPPGHRLTMHSADYREVGVGIVNGTNGKSGPQVVTQDFATSRNPSPFITGVVYYDLNNNQFYDLGEGIEGIVITALGSQFFARSARSGGFSIPVPGDGTYQVTFALGDSIQVERAAVVARGENVKVDLTPIYNPPVISGPNRPAAHRSHRYTFSSVPGATSYQWRQAKAISPPAVEGGEEGLARVKVDTTPGYEVLNTAIAASGSRAFHLAHPFQTEADLKDQVIALQRVYLVNANSRLSFASRLGWASPKQIAKAQVSSDGGGTWQEVWSQAGTDNQGEERFAQRSVSLQAFQGKEIRLRFLYVFDNPGDFFPQTDPGVGWYLDNITVAEASELSDERVLELDPSSQFEFSPAELGEVLLSVRPVFSGRLFPWGPAKSVLVVPEDPAGSDLPRITRIQVLPNGEIAIDFLARSGSGLQYLLESTPSLTSSWQSLSQAQITARDPNGNYRATSNMPTDRVRFYRIRSP